MTSPTTRPMLLAEIAPEVLQDLAIKNGVCVRPVLTRMTDTATGQTSMVPIPCGSTQDRKCPPCADRARKLRMQQCREGWHRDDDPELLEHDPADSSDDDDDLEDLEALEDPDELGEEAPDPDESGRRVRSTRRRQDVPDLPRVPMDDRTTGKTFRAPNGRTYRPSMFLTLTLPSYGRVHTRPQGRPCACGVEHRDGAGVLGTPVDPKTYDYHRAAMDALHFPRLVDRFWQNLRRCAGYKVQYFASVEAQRRLAPHLHAAVRGVIPRSIVRQVVDATYHQLWSPPCDPDAVVYNGVDSADLPVWDELASAYVDPATGVILPTWDDALDDIGADPTARPAHVLRLGDQTDYQGIVADTHDGRDGRRDKVGKAIGYLTKYLVKDIADTYGDPDDLHPAQAAHIERLHEHVRWLPCAPTCANWLRYGIQPKNTRPGLVPGWCSSKAHDRWHLGLGGRRVLVSRQWTGKTLTEHRADRAEVVRQTLAAAGVDMPDTDRYATTQTNDDGTSRYVWTPVNPDDSDAPTYRRVLADAIAQRARWRTEYEQAKAKIGQPAPVNGPPGELSATEQRPANTAA